MATWIEAKKSSRLLSEVSDPCNRLSERKIIFRQDRHQAKITIQAYNSKSLSQKLTKHNLTVFRKRPRRSILCHRRQRERNRREPKSSVPQIHILQSELSRVKSVHSMLDHGDFNVPQSVPLRWLHCLPWQSWRQDSERSSESQLFHGRGDRWWDN